MKKKAIVENDKAKIEKLIVELDEKKNATLQGAYQQVNKVGLHIIGRCGSLNFHCYRILALYSPHCYLAQVLSCLPWKAILFWMD